MHYIVVIAVIHCLICTLFYF